MKLQITQEDIDNGEQCNSCECPIALAVKRTYPEAAAVIVGAHEVEIFLTECDVAMGRKPTRTCLLGEGAIPFITLFDDFINPDPCGVELFDPE